MDEWVRLRPGKVESRAVAPAPRRGQRIYLLRASRFFSSSNSSEEVSFEAGRNIYLLPFLISKGSNPIQKSITVKSPHLSLLAHALCDFLVQGQENGFDASN